MAVNHQEIIAAPAVLKWARETLGLTIDQSAKKAQVKPEKIEAWETGSSSPTYKQLEALAYKVYMRPLAVFFLDTPPDEKPIEKDFRTLPVQEARGLSPAMRLCIRKAKRLQRIATELNSDNPETQRYREFQVSVDDNPKAVAHRFREFIGLTLEHQKKWKVEDAFNQFRYLVESIGIYVFQFEMPIHEARAFSLTDDFPVIVLNANDAKNGRIFSLFHEICHVLFNVGGIFRDQQTGLLTGDLKKIEDFCNSFAASFLIPDDLFGKDVQHLPDRRGEWSDDDLEKMGRLYKVSKEVVLRKLIDYNLASWSFYFRRKRFWDADLARHKKQKLERDAQLGRTFSGRAPDEKTVTEKGKSYIRKVWDNYNKGYVEYSDLPDLLGVKTRYIDKVMERALK